MATRYSKILLVLAVGLLTLVIAINNLVDYDSNFLYVQHVLSMDTTFATSQLRSRAIVSVALQTFVYRTMITTELAISGLCLWGTMELLRAVNLGGMAFNRAKAVATAGLTLAFLFWFAGFMVIGGEWFAMWQSHDWNGQQPAFRFIGCVGLVLIYLHQPDLEPEGGDPPAESPPSPRRD